MILAFVLLLFSQAAADTTPADEEIVVTAKLDRIQMRLGRDARGKTVCSLDRSSGDPKVDAAFCKEAAKCVKRKPMATEELNACLAKRKEALVKRWQQPEGRAL